VDHEEGKGGKGEGGTNVTLAPAHNRNKKGKNQRKREDWARTGRKGWPSTVVRVCHTYASQQKVAGNHNGGGNQRGRKEDHIAQLDSEAQLAQRVTLTGLKAGMERTLQGHRWLERRGVGIRGNKGGSRGWGKKTAS